MPTDVHNMPAAFRADNFTGQSYVKKSRTAEVKSGFLVLLGHEKLRQDVRVVVYCTTLEHFAVIYPRKRLSKSIGVVNLRNASVERTENESGFTVRQKGYDNTISAKFLCSERDIETWMCAFKSRISPSNQQHTNSLPVLLEDEEIYDN